MQLGQVEAFVETAKQGSISRAAERLHLTQPSVTSRLQGLEIEVGEPLFTRVKYGVTLTEAGKTLLPYAERALQNLSEGSSALKHRREATEGELYLGSSSLISTYVLPGLLERFAAKHPRVRVLVRTGHTEEVLVKVLRGEVQIGLIYQLRHPDVESVHLSYDELVLAVPPGHHLGCQTSVSLEDVAAEALVLLGSATYFERVNNLFLNARLAPKAQFEVDNVEAAKKMVEIGLGVALLHRVTIERELALGTLKAVPLADSPQARREMMAIYRRTSGLGGIGRAFLATIPEVTRPHSLDARHGH